MSFGVEPSSEGTLLSCNSSQSILLHLHAFWGTKCSSRVRKTFPGPLLIYHKTLFHDLCVILGLKFRSKAEIVLTILLVFHHKAFFFILAPYLGKAKHTILKWSKFWWSNCSIKFSRIFNAIEENKNIVENKNVSSHSFIHNDLNINLDKLDYIIYR